jgi:hypothetical protein
VPTRSARGVERRTGRDPREQTLHHWLLDSQNEIQIRVVCRSPGRVTCRSIELGQRNARADTIRRIDDLAHFCHARGDKSLVTVNGVAQQRKPLNAQH